MMEPEIRSHSFVIAELRSECVRVRALLGVFAVMLALLLIRGVTSLIQGQRGAAWPFALLLAAMTAYELGWFRFVKQAMESTRVIPPATWIVNIFVESLLPTITVFLQIHTSFIGPARALTSPVVLAYFLFIMLSALHLNSGLSRLAGGISAASYAVVSLYTFLRFPAGAKLLDYTTSFSYVVVLLAGGFAAAAMARQIHIYVIAALHDAEGQAKIAQLEHDLGIARSIQQGLLPQTSPRTETFDIAGWNRPADETGGDYFDWQTLADGRLAVTIADVTGHGIASALGMAVCRAYARAGFAIETDLRCFLERLSRLLYADLPPEKFVTLAAGLLDPGKAILNLISAGHGPLLFYSAAEDCFHTYEAQGPPLGLLPHVTYRNPRMLKFVPGDILTLVTDGIIESTNNQDEDFGQARVENVVRACRDMPAAGIISELYSSIKRFAGSMRQLDDLTVLIVKCIGATPSEVKQTA